jgi:hypothetical protein
MHALRKREVFGSIKNINLKIDVLNCLQNLYENEYIYDHAYIFDIKDYLMQKIPVPLKLSQIIE